MKLWDNIRNYFYRRTLAKRLPAVSATRKITNLHDAKSIEIIYDSTAADNDNIVIRFAESLRKQGKSVDLLGFVNDTKTERKADVPIFNKKKLTWYRTPNDEQVESFAKKEPDLLLGCFTGENLPLEFIAQISKAKWRVGAYNESKTDCYDMMISVDERKDISYLIDQTVHFLNQIKYDTN